MMRRALVTAWVIARHGRDALAILTLSRKAV